MCPYEKDDKFFNEICWVIFLEISKQLYTKMFQDGLSVRGAISFGKFMTQGYTFVGQPIIEAYESSQELNISLCVLSESAIEEIKRINHNDIEGEDYYLKQASLNYEVPLKNNKSKRFNVIPMDINKIDTTDIRQIVMESFWKHGKDIPPHSYSKVDNTERFIRHVKSITAK